MSETIPAPAPAKKRRFGCLSMIMLLLSLLLLGAAVGIWMAKSDPAQLKQLNETMAAIKPEEQAQRADALEARVVSAMQGIDSKTGPVVTPKTNASEIIDREISISAIDANLWLATKFDQWLTNQKAAMPEMLSDPRVWIEDEKLVLSSRLKLPALQGVVSFVLDGKMNPDGQMALKIVKIRTGTLRLPGGLVADQVRDEFKNAQSGIVKMIGDSFEGMTIDPVFPDAGDKSRMSRIMDFKIHADRIDLKIRNGPKDAILKKQGAAK